MDCTRKRQEDSHIIELVQEEILDEKRPLGRPKMKQKSNFKSDLRTLNIDLVNQLMMNGNR